ncbi:G patch domain-containing protein 1 [Holothuria leucospilota]|uniref:G patch domain-containing protein 1 n=1 Tax=Holothuria leucospilota TaxID=206669 RepID=A0A9Q1CBK4_HOLLE|nr:G patch domain-containing protein 1 [Holothuria leucospilota]
MPDGVGSCLEGFTPASGKKKCITKVFSPLALPPGFQPVHIFSDSLAPKEEEKFSRFTLSSAQRSALLGEEVLPGKSPPSESTSLAVVPRDDKGRLPSSSDSGASSLRESKTKKKSRFSDLSPHQDSATSGRESVTEGITEWERQRGRTESLQGSALYNPISSMMASRFVSAKYRDEEQVEYSAENEVDKSHQENAAEMKMYGKLTRETFEWHPDHVLCKRFNVPDPYPGSTTVGIPGMKRDKLSVFSFLSIPANMAETTLTPVNVSAPKVQEKQNMDEPSSSKNQTNKKTRWDIKPAILGIIEERRKNPSQETCEGEKEGVNEEQEDNRPPMDLFNAIFNETDSSDSDSSDGKDEGDNQMTSQTDEKLPPLELNGKSEVSNSIVADLVREDSTKHSIVSDPISTDSATHSRLQMVVTHATPDRGSPEEDEQYGPALPPPSSGHFSDGISGTQKGNIKKITMETGEKTEARIKDMVRMVVTHPTAVPQMVERDTILWKLPGSPALCWKVDELPVEGQMSQK